jgi:hypothetical protein
VRGAGDAMKLALRRKQSQKLVERKDAVLALVKMASEMSLSSVDSCVAAVQEVERAADDVGLPLTGDSWGERLAIKAKGGGMHFDDDSRRAATAAFQRLGTLRQAVTWHLQLTSRGKQITSAVGGFRAKGGSGASMSKAKMLDKMSELLGAVSKTIKDIFSDGAFRVVTSDMSRQGLPQSLDEDADALRRQTLLLAEFAHQLATTELEGLRKESKVTQRFRAPQTLAVLTTAGQLMRAVDSAVRPTAFVSPDDLASVSSAIAEVEPMADSALAGDDDELDDEI